MATQPAPQSEPAQPQDAPAAPDGALTPENALAPIIVKKITIEEGGHHGGAWKVAYADFVTAMMAFFLLLWLLGATTEDQRKGLADYFTPTLVKLKEQSAGSDGMLGGSSITDADNYPNRAGQTGTQSITIPRAATGGAHKDGAPTVEEIEAQAEHRRKAMMAQIKRRLEQERALRKLVRQVRVVRTPEGIRIDLVDDADFSMFALGTTVLVPEARQLIGVIAQTLGSEGPSAGAQLIVRGHTDALKWKPGVRANNWSLSTGRAEATRQELLRGGLAEGRFARIEGVADRELLVKENPADPRNRRISVLVLD
ncbi:flagellar motor protein MotB [Parerythrobacter jejuensis]|uniref:OmpA family protein n=1 Tax=Parerythrobacter jejuensis TaxID=795812 RepID=A0A845ANX1_9SPHN|nr:flagellar motor protein MotB [Parerythrobacter jejuensis]MXP30605.1 OmpA family protein [Parerythrobacter jejuensis]MXP33365.1 OmpA family protein [Parerythrobacter jejuensis]